MSVSVHAVHIEGIRFVDSETLIKRTETHSFEELREDSERYRNFLRNEIDRPFVTTDRFVKACIYPTYTRVQYYIDRIRSVVPTMHRGNLSALYSEFCWYKFETEVCVHAFEYIQRPDSRSIVGDGKMDKVRSDAASILSTLKTLITKLDDVVVELKRLRTIPDPAPSNLRGKRVMEQPPMMDPKPIHDHAKGESVPPPPPAKKERVDEPGVPVTSKSSFIPRATIKRKQEQMDYYKFDVNELVRPIGVPNSEVDKAAREKKRSEFIDRIMEKHKAFDILNKDVSKSTHSDDIVSKALVLLGQEDTEPSAVDPVRGGGKRFFAASKYRSLVNLELRKDRRPYSDPEYEKKGNEVVTLVNNAMDIIKHEKQRTGEMMDEEND